MSHHRSYDDLDAGRGCNYWTYDRTLKRHARRVYGDEYDWAEPELEAWGELGGVEDALVALADASREEAQVAAKDLADYVFDVYTSGILLAHAETRINEADDAREAAVANAFVEECFITRPGRAMPNECGPDLDAFDAVVRYARLDPDRLVEPEAAD